MKKVPLLLIVIALIAPSLFAAPSDEEVEAAFSGAFAAYGALFLTSMLGQNTTGVTVTMNAETGESSMVMEDVDVEALFAAINETMDGSGDMPEIEFTRMSGTISSNAEGDMNMDVTLKGGPVNHLEMQTKGEALVMMKANGKDYDFLSKEMDL